MQTRFLVLLASVLLLIGCGRREDVASSEPPPAPVEQQAVAPPPPSPDCASSPTRSVCAAPVRIDPRKLSADWPTELDRRIRFAARIERSLDFSEVLITAKGRRFVVLLSPNARWTGDADRTYRVMGSTIVNLHGPVTLPELVLESQDDCGS